MYKAIRVLSLLLQRLSADHSHVGDMGAVDPSYPLLPIASVLAATMLLLVLLTASVRQQWNFGVALLCFWLLLQNATGAVNTVLWSDNADVRLYVYCDIGM